MAPAATSGPPWEAAILAPSPHLWHLLMANATRVVFATFGSLGDLHPYVAISQELVRRGHRPLIATFEEYRGAVEAAGIEFAPAAPPTTAPSALRLATFPPAL